MEDEGKRRQTRPFRVLLTGDNDSLSAPNRTFARALMREGFDARFRPDLPLVSGTEWLRAVRDADAVIHVEYGDADPYSARQLAVAAALGRPVIRWWVGTDVLGCLREPPLRRKAALIERVAALSTVSAPHLADELAAVGVKARFIPPPLDSDVGSKAAVMSEVPRSVLVYLPTYRLDFYGAHVVRELARRNPDLRFVIVGDESHHLRDLPNVTSLGWVPDMERIYGEAGCVLRMTEHDAVPRMLVEALVRGRYVIHSWPLAGCWLAKTTEQAHEQLKLFRNAQGPNVEGAAAIARLYDPAPEAVYARLLRSEARRWAVVRRARAVAIAATLTVQGRVKKLRRDMRAREA